MPFLPPAPRHLRTPLQLVAPSTLAFCAFCAWLFIPGACPMPLLDAMQLSTLFVLAFGSRWVWAGSSTWQYMGLPCLRGRPERVCVLWAGVWLQLRVGSIISCTMYQGN